MSTFKISKKLQKSRATGIHSGDLVLFKLPNGDLKGLKVDENTMVNLGKVGFFHSDDLIGQPYGRTYEVEKKRLHVLPPRTLEEVEDTDATNEMINDGEFVQPLTAEEIQTLRKSGVHASEIIKKQIEQHANYSLKTEYSKDKYKKRKEAKYSRTFSTTEPTVFNICEYWFVKDQNRIRDLRADSLSQMLNLANVRPGGRYLAVDDASGMLVAGILERLGGEGRLLSICNSDSPPAYPVLPYMNFDPSIIDVLSSLNWATSDEEYEPILPPSELPDDQIKSDRQKNRLHKRKAISDLLSSTRDELFSGDFDGLLISSEYEPFSIIERLSPYVAGSASIVVHSPYPQVVVDLQAKLRNLQGYLSPTITEAWLRRYQILPGRTHPMMAMSGSGGFILHVIKIYDNPSAAFTPRERRRRKNKISKVQDEDAMDQETPVSVKSQESTEVFAEVP